MVRDNMGPFIRQNKNTHVIGKKVKFVRACFIAHTLFTAAQRLLSLRKERKSILFPRLYEKVP